MMPMQRFFADVVGQNHVVSLMKIQAGKITRLAEYWGEDGPPPAWRRQKQIGRPIV